MNMNNVICLGAASLALSTAHAYNEINHQQMSEIAVDRSVLASPTKRFQIGLQYGVRDPRQLFPANMGSRPFTVIEAVSLGAYQEDHGPTDKNPLNHFFNPVDGSRLFTNFLFNNTTSPDWALEDQGTFGGNETSAGPQQYSYRLALNYYFNALTASTKASRRVEVKEGAATLATRLYLYIHPAYWPASRAGSGLARSHPSMLVRNGRVHTRRPLAIPERACRGSRLPL